MKFSRLRLSGFKSFVEPTELFIEPGLTAIVGPNGCGKSNLFDALRWVMGETRPTSVRGAEMDDVIFAGSAARPARNMAEVTLTVDNSDRSANPPYADYDTIEISRRIEREAGSVYRINGRDVRQRDVQIFFADASSGASSTAFVRQGQISLLISQKPLARRAILEEAAGITGLHQRRHEAELRLRAAESNLSRLDDVIREVEGQLQSLKRQARQASRYRNLSGHIRRAEALAHYLRWTAAELRARTAEEALAAATNVVATCTEHAVHASTAQADAATALPPLRQIEAEKSAALHRLVVEREALDAEEARARELAQSLRQRLTQAAQDLERERALDRDAETALGTLAAESNELEAAQERAGVEIDEAQTRAEELNEALAQAERLLERLTSELAERNARKDSLERSRRLAAELAETSGQQLVEAEARLTTAMEGAAAAPDVRAAEDSADEARQLAETASALAAEARTKLAETELAEAATRGPLEDSEREVQRLSAEAKALSDLLRPEGQSLWPPLVDAVSVQPGYEAALAAALGDDLEAPLDEAAPHHWRDLGDFDEKAPLPEGAKPLAEFVKGPSALSRRLSMTGVVFPDQGIDLQKELKAGQRLVSPRGDLWRWDGYRASADAPSAAAVRLAQHNRLAALEEQIVAAKEARATTFAAYSTAKEAASTARDAAREAEQSERRHEHAIIAAQDAATKAVRAAAERASRLASLEAEIRRLTQARDAAQESEQQAAQALAELGDGQALTQSVANAREQTSEARAASSNARATLEGLKRDGEGRARRLSAIVEERARWEARRSAAVEHIAELDRRSSELNEELAVAEALPQTIAEKRGTLLDAIGVAEAARNQAGDARAEAEACLAEADKVAKAADHALSAAREERAREEALLEGAQSRITELRERIRDELEIVPDELAALAELKDDEELPQLEQAEKKVEKLKQEREQLGGVNLRAEEEANEHEQRLATLTGDRDDLTGAIDRLRRGIQSLNREGRERLHASFEKVNANFQTLFAKLFEGGEAKLTFTESEDPLEAGLEIYARPPGKRLQALSLLSGGEQALTAMSLIFAVFLVNPAPVCVLDEVDAPLDDANVERFCNLLDEMTRITNTRFLVITHHALTMSRMHRLFGVTMAERGISQLVSVTLAEAERVAAE
ncbi:MAG: chromosome segregation protein SMC [Alphaproteobacteria bacterium]|nr:chromosome segregation protein SMC [Alphaproteobacteria bacterium]